MELRILALSLFTLGLSAGLIAKPPVSAYGMDVPAQEKNEDKQKKSTETKVIKTMLCNGAIVTHYE